MVRCVVEVEECVWHGRSVLISSERVTVCRVF